MRHRKYLSSKFSSTDSLIHLPYCKEMVNRFIVSDFSQHVWDVHKKTTSNPGCGRRNGPIGRTSVLNDDGMAACGISGIFMARKVLASLSEVSRNSTKPMKMIIEKKNNFWKGCEKRCSSIKLFMDTFE